MDNQRKELAEFFHLRLDRHIDTSNLTDDQVIELANKGEYVPYTGRDIDTALHNLANMHEVRESNPEWHHALTLMLLAMKKVTSESEGWKGNVYHL